MPRPFMKAAVASKILPRLSRTGQRRNSQGQFMSKPGSKSSAAATLPPPRASLSEILRSLVSPETLARSIVRKARSGDSGCLALLVQAINSAPAASSQDINWSAYTRDSLLKKGQRPAPPVGQSEWPPLDVIDEIVPEHAPKPDFRTRE